MPHAAEVSAHILMRPETSDGAAVLILLRSSHNLGEM